MKRCTLFKKFDEFVIFIFILLKNYEKMDNQQERKEGSHNGENNERISCDSLYFRFEITPFTSNPLSSKQEL
jgi:hypothetical protein